MLDACVDVEWVTLDMTDLVESGYYESESPLASEARRSVFASYNPLTPTLILAEGSTDIAVLRSTLPILHPELVDYFSFFNHAHQKFEANHALSGGSALNPRHTQRTAHAATERPTKAASQPNNDPPAAFSPSLTGETCDLAKGS